MFGLSVTQLLQILAFVVYGGYMFFIARYAGWDFGLALFATGLLFWIQLVIDPIGVFYAIVYLFNKVFSLAGDNPQINQQMLYLLLLLIAVLGVVFIAATWASIAGWLGSFAFRLLVLLTPGLAVTLLCLLIIPDISASSSALLGALATAGAVFLINQRSES